MLTQDLEIPADVELCRAMFDNLDLYMGQNVRKSPVNTTFSKLESTDPSWVKFSHELGGLTLQLMVWHPKHNYPVHITDINLASEPSKRNIVDLLLHKLTAICLQDIVPHNYEFGKLICEQYSVSLVREFDSTSSLEFTLGWFAGACLEVMRTRARAISGTDLMGLIKKAMQKAQWSSSCKSVAIEYVPESGYYATSVIRPSNNHDVKLDATKKFLIVNNPDQRQIKISSIQRIYIRPTD